MALGQNLRCFENERRGGPDALCDDGAAERMAVMTLPLSLVLLGALAALPLRAPKDTHSGKTMRVRHAAQAPPMPVPPTPEQIERLHARLAERRMREMQSHVRRDMMVFETPRESGDYLYIIQQGRGGLGGLKTLATVAGGV